MSANSHVELRTAMDVKWMLGLQTRGARDYFNLNL